MNKKTNKVVNLNGKKLDSITINYNDRIVTAASSKVDLEIKCVNVFGVKIPVSIEPKTTKVVTTSRCHENDEFDPYVGVALAVAENVFGSRTQFIKFVNEHCKVVGNLHNQLDDMNIVELRKLASTHNIKNYTRYNKVELIRMLKGMIK